MRNKKTDFDTTPVCPATPAADERAPVAPKAKQCVACEGATSGDNIPCAVCRADPAPQPNENPLSDEYVNVVIRGYGYGSPECVIARLHQWIGLHGGKNNVTLLMYEAHKALVKLRTPVADERAAFKKCHAAIIKAISSIARTDGPDTRKEDDPELIYRSPVMAEVARIRGALDECSAALASAPVAGEVQPVELRAVTETIKEGDGFWRSCTGCHELNEGHDTGPYSAVLQCHLGNGCSECGGIGAIWDNTDYQAMGDAMARDIGQSVAPQASPAADDQSADDTALLDWLREETCDLRCVNEPSGWDDFDVRWRVIQHHMAAPHERIIGESFSDEPRDAIRAAIAAQQGEGGGV